MAAIALQQIPLEKRHWPTTHGIATNSLYAARVDSTHFKFDEAEFALDVAKAALNDIWRSGMYLLLDADELQEAKSLLVEAFLLRRQVKKDFRSSCWPYDF
ncbi:MAG: hypothetical protein NT157_05275 [Candidatus Micrarchaeota archaeon]|nr:hypothetical protein [Candidatus Micrarchaeota archaeon]